MIRKEITLFINVQQIVCKYEFSPVFPIRVAAKDIFVQHPYELR